jgi:CheY-like chemotaxis protein
VAEDNEINQKYIKALLEYLGCEAVLVQNGRELLEVLEREAFDAIIMDKNMPEMNGIEASRIIRDKEGQSGKRIPIIALTAAAIKGDKEQLLAAGMDYYLAKPLTEKELVSVLMEIAAGRKTDLNNKGQEKKHPGLRKIQRGKLLSIMGYLWKKRGFSGTN